MSAAADRISELVIMGVVEDSGRKRRGKTVYVLTELGQKLEQVPEAEREEYLRDLAVACGLPR